MYSLTLDNDNRILSATYPQFNPNGLIVEELPQGNICDYIVVITEATEDTEQSIEYVYQPLPIPEEPESEEAFMLEYLADFEERISLIELGL